MLSLNGIRKKENSVCISFQWTERTMLTEELTGPLTSQGPRNWYGISVVLLSTWMGQDPCCIRPHLGSPLVS